MSEIVIVGGRLQGIEAAFLAKKAGMHTTLIDADENCIAQRICDRFICGDVLSDDPAVTTALAEADMIMPAMENAPVLERLTGLCRENGYILAFDWDAYQVSRSKRKSDAMFAAEGMPCPRYYPEGKLPYIAKPDSESGSHGVTKLTTQEALDEFVACQEGSFLIQEYIEGPSYSVEVIGYPGNYRTYALTEIFVDHNYDCNVAATYRTLAPELEQDVRDLAVACAEKLQLKGIMDIEVIYHEGQMKVLEIDARIPSQTSIVSLLATGMNYMTELYDVFCHGRFCSPMKDKGDCAYIAQYVIDEADVQCLGERVMTEGGILHLDEELLPGATAITDHEEGKKQWRVSCFTKAATYQEILDKKEQLEAQL